MSEDRLIGWLRQELARRGRDLLGDDAAFLDRERWAVTVDQQIAGTHFQPGTSPAVVARRLLAVNLSDLAAVGAEPALALLTVAVPPGYRLKTFFRALLSAAERHGLLLAGGDVARSPNPSFGLTVFGRRLGRWVRRDQGRAGDALWVGGSLGEAAAGRSLVANGAAIVRGRVRLGPAAPPGGLARAARRAVLRHLEPKPQLEIGRWLARRRRAAAIDLSDGLLLDLERLCRASGTGAVIDPTKLPMAPRFRDLSAHLGVDPLELAATGGEDYVLLFALPAGIRPPSSLAARRIGSLDEGRAVRLIGRPIAFTRRGWDHLTAG